MLPRLAELVDVPLIVSVGGFGTGDYARVVEELDGEAAVAAFELNLSCPNVESGCASIGFDPRETEAAVSACRTRTDRAAAREARADHQPAGRRGPCGRGGGCAAR